MITKKLDEQRVFRISVALIVLTFFTIRILGLGSDMLNSDGGRWHRRSEAFLIGIKNGDLKATYQRYHPGVTLMWVNSVVKETVFRFYLLSGKPPLTLENADNFVILHALSKSANIVVLTLLLIFQIHAVYKIFGKNVAVLYGVLLSFEPYLIGIDRWFHLTSFETYFSFSSVLALLLWRKTKNNRVLYLSSIFLALSALSKLTTLLIAPLFLYVILKKCFEEKEYKVFLYFSSIFLAVILVFFPAIWASPEYVFSRISNAFENSIETNVRQEMLSPIVSYFYYPIILMFKLSPLTFILFVCALFRLKNSRNCYTLFIFADFSMYIFTLTFFDQKIDRYSIALFPSLLLLISISFANTKLRNYIIGACLATVIYIFAQYYPVYSSYYSPLFGGAKKALQNGVYENSGEYFANAAFYLNKVGRDKYTYVPNNIESFLYFYKGKIQRDFTSETNYIVHSLDIDRQAINETRCPKLIKTFGSPGFNAVFIFECEGK